MVTGNFMALNKLASGLTDFMSELKWNKTKQAKNKNAIII